MKVKSKEIISDEELAELYLNKNMSSYAISEMISVHVSTVCRRLKKLGITKPATGHEGRNGKKGTVYIKGYPVVYMPEHPRAKNNGYVMKHILVMENVLGRTPKKGEEIHHIDLDKENSNPENLLLLQNHDEHMELHKQLVDVLHSIGLGKDDGKMALKNGLIGFSNGMYSLISKKRKGDDANDSSS